MTALAVVAAVPVGLLVGRAARGQQPAGHPEDAAAGKRTLAVRIGDAPTRRLYVAILAVAAAVVVVIGLGPDSIRRPWALLTLLASPLALAPIRIVRSGAGGPALIPALGTTGRYQLVAGRGAERGDRVGLRAARVPFPA